MSCPNCGLRSEASSGVEIQPLPTAVLSCLQSNNPAPFQETSRLRNLLNAAQNMVCEIDFQIETMQASIVRLSEKRNTLRLHIDAYKTVLHPIRSLPFDVLQHIFRHCVEDDQDYRSLSTMEQWPILVAKCSQLLVPFSSSLDTKKAPWLISQVSHSWRLTTLECPSLWSALTLDIERTGKGLGLLSLMSLQLRRSRDTPLSVVVLAESRISSPLIALLCSYSSNWRRLVTIASPKNLVTFASYIHGALPALEFLCIYTDEPGLEWREIHRKSLSDAFQFCPRLHWFHANDIPQALSITLPWRQITELSISHSQSLVNGTPACTNGENLTTLRQAKSLQFATIYCCFDTSTTFTSNSVLSHSRLRGLHLQSGHKVVQDITQFLDCLLLPALEDLCVSVGAVPASVDNGESSILRFLERSSPPLETFFLEDIRMSHATSLNIFLALPKVRVLGLYGITEGMLQALHWRGQSTTGDGGAFLPKLECLHLYGPETDIDQALLVGMIESRFKPGASTSSELQMDASSTSNGSEHPTCSSLALVQTTKPFKLRANVLHRVKRLMTAGFKFRRSSST